MPLLRLHQQIALCIPDGFALRRKQRHGIFTGQMLGGFLQCGGFLGRKPDGVVGVEDAEGQRPAGKGSQITLDALCGFQNIVPCTHKEYVIAAGIDDAYLQTVQNAVDITLEKQGHLPGECRGAGQVDIAHPPHRVFFALLLKTGDERMAEVVHIHAADRNAAHARSLLGQFVHTVAGGVIAHIQVGGGGKAAVRGVFCVCP